jgi:hypothetical protein
VEDQRTDTCRYNFSFKIPPECQLRGNDAVSAQQLARLLVTIDDFLGPDFVFDQVSKGWSPKSLFESPSETKEIDMGKRRDGGKNTIVVTISKSKILDIRGFVGWLRSGQYVLNPYGHQKMEDILKWLQATFRKEPAARFATKPNGNAYFARSPETSMALRSTNGVLEALRGVFQTMQIRFGRLTLNVVSIYTGSTSRSTN